MGRHERLGTWGTAARRAMAWAGDCGVGGEEMRRDQTGVGVGGLAWRSPGGPRVAVPAVRGAARGAGTEGAE